MQPSNPNAQPTSIFGTAQASNWSNPFGGQASAGVAQQTQTVVPQSSAPPQPAPAPFNNAPQTRNSPASIFGAQVSASALGHTQITAIQTSAPTQPQPPTRASNTAAAPSILIRRTQAAPTNALSNPFSGTTQTTSSRPGVPVAAQAVPASKHVLGLSDLLVCIFSEADQNALAAAARVNRQWSLYALDRLWRNLKTVVPLLEILAPLVNSAVPGTSAWTRLTQWNLPETISSNQWQRLEFYSKMVHSLSHDDSLPVRSQPGVVSKEVYSKIHYHYLHRDHFLPNLRSLSWVISRGSCVEALLSILSPNIRELKLTFNGGNEVGTFLEELKGRTRHITTLSIVLKQYAPSHFNAFSGTLASIITSSPNLTIIALPQFALTQVVIAALGSLHYLKRLLFSDEGTYTTQGDASGCTYPFSANTFRALEELAYNHWLENATFMIQTQRPPQTLTRLFISTQTWITTKAAFDRFLSVLAFNIPRLESLRLNLWGNTWAASEALDLSNLTLLGRLRLKCLQIGHSIPIGLNVSQLTWMAATWPSLEELWLTPDPVVANIAHPPQGSDISLLYLAAKHLPSLRGLGLYVNANSLIGHADSRFKRLEVLDLGTSTILGQTSEEVAAFLVDVMPDSGTKLTTGPSDWHSQPSNDPCRSAWDGVRKLIPEYLRVQAGLRHRMALAERETKRFQEEAEALKKEVATLKQQLITVQTEAVTSVSVGEHSDTTMEVS